MAFYPININISNRRCLVVGGGSVAARKIASLLDCEALVRVVSPEVCGTIATYANDGRLEWIRRDYHRDDLEEVFLVFAATDQPLVQKRVARDAEHAGVLLNSADDPERCDFQVPAKVRRGNLLIAVSTGGASPALAAQLKQRLLQTYGPEYAIFVELMSMVRQQVVGKNRESEENRQLFHRLLTQPLAEMIEKGQWEEILLHLESVLPKEINSREIVSAFVTKGNNV